MSVMKKLKQSLTKFSYWNKKSKFTKNKSSGCVGCNTCSASSCDS